MIRWQVAKAILEKYWTTAPPKQFVLKRETPVESEGEHCPHGGTPRPDPATPGGPTAFIEFTVCRDDSVVERAKFREDKCRLGEEAQATPRQAY
jgi:hypothetical protein